RRPRPETSAFRRTRARDPPDHPTAGAASQESDAPGSALVVERDHPIDPGDDVALDDCMVRVGEIGIARGGVAEGHTESVRVAVVEALVAAVGAAGEVDDAVDLVLKARELDKKI